MCFWVVNSSLSIDEYWFRATAGVLRNWVNNYFLAVESGRGGRKQKFATQYNDNICKAAFSTFVFLLRKGKWSTR